MDRSTVQHVLGPFSFSVFTVDMKYITVSSFSKNIHDSFFFKLQQTSAKVYRSRSTENVETGGIVTMTLTSCTITAQDMSIIVCTVYSMCHDTQPGISIWHFEKIF